MMKPTAKNGDAGTPATPLSPCGTTRTRPKPPKRMRPNMKKPHTIFCLAALQTHSSFHNFQVPFVAEASRSVLTSVLSNLTRRKRKTGCRTTFQWIDNGNESINGGFPGEEECESVFDGRAPMEFNHEFVGITNPCPLNSPKMCGVGEPETGVGGDKFWWPGDGCDDLATDDEKNGGYRILRYRRKVGTGEACYASLRDVIMNWEGLHQGSSWAGIRRVNNKKRGRDGRSSSAAARFLMDGDVNCVGDDPLGALPEDVSDRVVQIWKSPGAKKMVTMSRVGGSRIWAMNPVMVVYDVIDRRGQGLTFSSTAYATLKGHLLTGEERVTVAIRDQSTQRHKPSAHIHHHTESNNDAGEVWVEVLSCSRPSSGLIGQIVFPFVKGMQERFFVEEVDTMERIAAKWNINRRT